MALGVHLSPPLVVRVESALRRLTRAAVAVLIVADHSTTARPGTPEPFGGRHAVMSGGAVGLAALWHVSWIPLQDPLQLLARESKSEPTP
jgi:hypothetical protein